MNKNDILFTYSKKLDIYTIKAICICFIIKALYYHTYSNLKRIIKKKEEFP